jgi:hypothetical protein
MTTSRPLISAMQVTLDGYSSEGDAEWSTPGPTAWRYYRRWTRSS